MADAPSTFLLAQISNHFAERGWNPETLDAFRMEGEGAAAPAAPTLDSIIDAGIANEPEPAAPAAPTPGEPAAPAAPPADDTSAFGEHADYIKQLRNESAKYRTERNQLQEVFGQAFDGYDPADRDTLLAVARGLRSDDPATRADIAEWLRGTAETLGATTPAGGDAPLTAAELDRILTGREQAKAAADAQAARLTAINAEVTELGYTPGSVDTQVLLSIALHETDGDLKAAHERLEARDKAAVDKYLAAKAAEANGTTGVVPPTGGAAPAPAEIHSVKDARAALEARFDSLGFK